ncbi:restriction endonuclease subunit S [Synechococcus sp. LA31]|uniref:restriction endonuclease subunit S n=1 Tax=Synechococcus sp. LA31 TaxID=2741953 RepID=UPI001BDDBFA9|nr:restriction endonuclease subunit S [Synechococcus sp. LA31]QVV67981.1 restriction endonuclease subunit S [Synechococcus sp. LA31]
MKHPYVALGEIVDFVGGGTPSREIESYWNGDIPWASVKDFKGQSIDGTKESITPQGLANSSSTIIPAGHVIIPTRMALGKAAINSIDVAINQDLKALKPKGEILTRYLMHALVAKCGEIQSLGKGATVKGVTIDRLSSLEIPLPPLEEQRRIAAILDKATALEDLSAKQSRLLEEAEKHLFLECFGSPFPGKTLWPVAQLGELGSLERGISKHRPRNDPSLMDGPYPFIQTGDVAGCGGEITTFSATYSDKGLAQSRLWPAGTLCITIAANIAKTGILDFDACFPDSVVGFQARNPAIITYVQCWMSFLQRHIEQMAPESAQKNINLEILRGLSIPVPSETALQKFHVAILALRCTLSRSTQRRRRTAELKSSLRSVSFAS